MAQSIREVVTPSPTVYQATASIADAARAMRDTDVGDVFRQRDGALCGIVTGRDIVVRAVAEDRNPSEARLGDICSQDLATLAPDALRNPTRDRHAHANGHPWTARSARTARP